MDAYQKVNDELNSLRVQLATERQDLTALTEQYERLCRASVDNEEAALEAAVLPAQREMIKARIHGLEIRIVEKEAMRAELVKPIMAAAERKIQEEAKAKWEGILAQCLKARDEFDELKPKLEPAIAAAKAAQEIFENALAALDQHRATPYNPVDFSPADLARARRRDAALQNAVREAQAQRDEALLRQGRIRSELMDVGTELARLAWLELNYRPQAMREAATATTLGEALSRP
jgi:chromosome segregation ATPase